MDFSFSPVENYYFESQDFLNITIDEEEHTIISSPSLSVDILKGNLLLV